MARQTRTVYRGADGWMLYIHDYLHPDGTRRPLRRGPFESEELCRAEHLRAKVSAVCTQHKAQGFDVIAVAKARELCLSADVPDVRRCQMRRSLNAILALRGDDYEMNGLALPEVTEALGTAMDAAYPRTSDQLRYGLRAAESLLISLGKLPRSLYLIPGPRYDTHIPRPRQPGASPEMTSVLLNHLEEAASLGEPRARWEAMVLLCFYRTTNFGIADIEACRTVAVDGAGLLVPPVGHRAWPKRVDTTHVVQVVQGFAAGKQPGAWLFSQDAAGQERPKARDILRHFWGVLTPKLFGKNLGVNHFRARGADA